ncbi:MAG: DUF1320 domain-containing protein [Rhodospirillales bacterium]
MTYASQQNLIDRFGERELIQLTDRAEPPTGAINSAVVGQALADADDLINSYVRKRYELPFATTPPALVRTAGDIARFYLHDERMVETVKENYEKALAFLKDIAAGRAELDVAGKEPAPVTDKAEVTGPARVFSRDKMKGY